MEAQQLLLLGTAMAISAIPTGLPAFVSGLLSLGAKQLAESKAVVKNLTDVETLGATSAINTDKTGTLTMNQMMVSTIYANGAWFRVEGEGYGKTGAITSVAGTPVPDFTRLALGLCLDSDATVADDGSVVGDPTEAALVVLAAKLGVGAEDTRRAYSRIAEVPFDSDYKFMATFHRVKVDGAEHLIQLVKGGPDVVLARCTESGGPLSGSQVPIEEARPGIDAANEQMGEKGLRVLAFAARLIDDGEVPAMTDDPMSLVHDLAFVGIVGMIDPLRAEARGAVQTALGAGIDVRMITGDHAVTAQAIGETLGLGPGAISGSELETLSDEELARRLPELHVFGRVSPEDKLRLARSMQQQGLIVAMTGDAVNDAAALKQADIGVAMGSGAEVTKQAARMILTDDNFGTLVHAVEIGRRVYDKVVSYVRFQMTQLLSLVMLFVAATAFNINEGVALTPSMVLYLLFFATAFGVVIIAVDPGDPDVMHRPPRDPKLPITNRTAIAFWLLYAAVLFLAALVPLVWGPDKPSTDHASVSMTMTFVVMGLGTVFNALTNRRDPTSGLTAPILKALAISLVPISLIFLATQLPRLESGLLTTSLTGPQWLASIGLALVLPAVIEGGKWIRRRRTPAAGVIDPRRAVAPARALTEVAS
jgi:Ca2+-transporting ATPase